MDDVLSMAEDWSFWGRPVPRSVPRDVDLPSALSVSLALVIQGVRRSGKSTLLQQLIERYRLDPKHCAFLNFEDPRLAGLLTYRTLDALVEQFRARHGRATTLYFFLDEIQWVEGWQRWLRKQLDRASRCCFVLTGSSAQLLSGELASTLTGRHLPLEIFPFSLREVRRAAPRTSVDRYLETGGFPEPLRLPDGDRLRRQYFTDIIERDVRERVGARSSQTLRQIVQMTFEAAGSELSLRRLAGAAGVAVDTVAGYLEACESAYLLFGCSYFAYSERKRAARQRKYYPVDTGLRRVAVTRTGLDRGKALECATFIALRRKHRQVHYWRQRGEVDFVIAESGRLIPVQVSWAGPTERHHKALEEFYETFPSADEGIFVTAHNFDAALQSTRG